MRLSYRFLLIILLLFSSTVTFSQTKKKKYKNESDKLTCLKKAEIGVEERLANYPYNLATQVKIVSFKDKSEDVFKSIIVGEALQEYLDLLVAEKDTLIENRFDEIEVLTFEQIEELTHIIYNYGYESETDLIIVTKCYRPKNAILFYDNSNKLIGFIELCFRCSRYRTNDTGINLGEECTEKIGLLKTFFKSCGINYGTEDY